MLRNKFLWYLGAFSCFCHGPIVPYSGICTIFTVVPGTLALKCAVRPDLPITYVVDLAAALTSEAGSER